MGHSLVHSLFRLDRSLTRLLNTARFARGLRWAHLSACLLSHSRARGKVNLVLSHSALGRKTRKCRAFAAFSRSHPRCAVNVFF